MERQKILEELSLILNEQMRERTEYRRDVELARLGLDSLAVAEIIAAIEEKFDCVIRMDDFIKLKTLDDFIDYILNEAQ